MRFIVDIFRTEGGVEGIVMIEGARSPQHFSGWLDLLRLLEAVERPDPGRTSPPEEGF